VESTNLLSRIEDAGLNASAPPQQRLLDGWLLRFSPGKAKRARCVNAIAPGRLPLSEKLSLCEEAYARVGLPLIVRITPFSEPPTLDETLRASGFERFDDTRVMVLANLSTLAPASLHLQLRAVGADEYAQAIGALRDSPPSQREAHAHRMRCSPVAYRGFVAERGGQTIACGQ